MTLSCGAKYIFDYVDMQIQDCVSVCEHKCMWEGVGAYLIANQHHHLQENFNWLNSANIPLASVMEFFHLFEFRCLTKSIWDGLQNTHKELRRKYMNASRKNKNREW